MKLSTNLHLALRLMSGLMPSASIRLHSVHTDIVTVFGTSFTLHNTLSLSQVVCRLYHLVSYNLLVTICDCLACSKALETFLIEHL